MKVFRIDREKYLPTTLTGIGASMSDAFRWNSEYTRMVYTAESRALSFLEIAVHLDLSEDLPTDRYLVEIDIPDSVPIKTVKNKDLPKLWDAKPPHPSSQKFGDQFVLENKFAVMRIPSSIIPQEFNYLINPLHPDSTKIKMISKEPIIFDQRFRH